MQAELGDITRSGTEAIINAANGCGIMGAGVAGAIAQSGGKNFKAEVKKIVEDNGRPFEQGQCYRSNSGRLRRRGVLYVYHAVTMTYPGGGATIHSVSSSMRAALTMAFSDGVKTIAIPGLGTGIGRLDKSAVACRMVNIAEEYDPLLEVFFIDQNSDLIEEIKKYIKK